MNSLPEHRRALNGRTWSSSWSAGSFDPISHYQRPHQHWASVALAVAIGVALALVLIYGGRL